MAEKLNIQEDSSNEDGDFLTENQEKILATLKERIHTVIGNELLEKEYRPATYAEAMLMSAGDEHQVLYNYARIRYKDLYSTASKRLKLSSELKGI